ncbi:hypothetical protein [Terrisporobacter petrolearius]
MELEGVYCNYFSSTRAYMSQSNTESYSSEKGGINKKINYSIQ